MLTKQEEPRIPLPKGWPFCWWMAVVIDHYSRRAMGFAIFRHNPTSVSIQSFLECAIVNASAAPRYIICDKGQQFWCSAFKDWCDDQGITPRFGAVGQHGSIALVERFILTLYWANIMRPIMIWIPLS